MELIIIFLIVLIVFGTGKLRNVGRELGGAISEFKDGIKKKDEDEDKKTDEVAEPVAKTAEAAEENSD